MLGQAGGRQNLFFWVLAHRDSRARPPYAVAADKSTRDEFRRFMEKNPDACDYHKAQVGRKGSAAWEGLAEPSWSFCFLAV